MSRSLIHPVACAAALLALPALVGAAPSAEKMAKPTDVVTSFHSLSKDATAINLVVAGQAKPVAVTFTQNSTFAGVCHDCELWMKYKFSESAKGCGVCACAVTNAQCLAWKGTKHNTWDEFLQALPKGIGLRAEFNTPGKPDSGLKGFIVDRRVALLPVDGLAGQTPDQLLALVKPIGGVKAELVADGKELQIALKDDWTPEKEAKLEKALAKANARVAYEPEKAAAQ